MARGMWRPLAPRSGGPAYTDRKSAMERIKRYRKLLPKRKFRLGANWDKSKFAVEIREMFE